VALRCAEQLVKGCVRRTPANADQNTVCGVEDAPALHVERDLGGNQSVVMSCFLLWEQIPMPVTDMARSKSVAQVRIS
jgi:hypothetical protein